MCIGPNSRSNLNVSRMVPDVLRFDWSRPVGEDGLGWPSGTAGATVKAIFSLTHYLLLLCQRIYVTHIPNSIATQFSSLRNEIVPVPHCVARTKNRGPLKANQVQDQFCWGLIDLAANLVSWIFPSWN